MIFLFGYLIFFTRMCCYLDYSYYPSLTVFDRSILNRTRYLPTGLPFSTETSLPGTSSWGCLVARVKVLMGSFISSSFFNIFDFSFSIFSRILFVLLEILTKSALYIGPRNLRLYYKKNIPLHPIPKNIHNPTKNQDLAVDEEVILSQTTLGQKFIRFNFLLLIKNV